MKTSSSARKLVRVRTTLGCLAFLALIGLEFGLGGSLAARFNQTRPARSANSAVWTPSVGVPDLFAASR